MSVDVLGTSCDQCWSMVQCSFTSTEARRLVRTDSPGHQPRLSHSLWTLIATDDDDDEVMLNVLRCRLTYWGQAVTNVEAWFNVALRPRKPEGSLGRTAQDGHLDSHTAPEQWTTYDDDDELMLNVLRCRLTYWGQAVTNAEAWFNIALRPRKPEGSLGRTAQDGHLDSHTAPQLWTTYDDDDDELMLNVLRCHLTY